MEHKTFFTLREAADYCRYSTETLYKAVSKGALVPFNNFSRKNKTKLLFKKEELDRWLIDR
jgi:hypothetical protein